MTNSSQRRPAIPATFSTGPTAVRVDRDVIRALGPDTEAFLQGQLSQDVAALADGQSAWSLLLQPQGKVDAWVRVTRRGPEEFLLDVDSGAGEAALSRLDRFKLRTDCELTLATWHIVSVRGPGAADVAMPADSGAEVVVAAEWPGVEGFDALGPDVAPPADLAVATADELDHLRVVLGIPAMGAELTEATIPEEAGIVERSVSFTKGCFTGQELVARIDSRGGNVPRRLRGIAGLAELSVGAPVQIDGEDVGVVTSVSGTAGLGYVKRSVESFPVDALVGGVEATLYVLPTA